MVIKKELIDTQTKTIFKKVLTRYELCVRIIFADAETACQINKEKQLNLDN